MIPVWVWAIVGVGGAVALYYIIRSIPGLMIENAGRKAAQEVDVQVKQTENKLNDVVKKHSDSSPDPTDWRGL